MDKDNRILASVALFSELFDRNQDVYHLVGEFIKSALISNRAWEFTLDEANHYLRDNFDFYLPKAVISKVLRLRLKAAGFVQALGKDHYKVTDPSTCSTNSLDDEFERLKQTYDSICGKLIEYSKAFTSTEHRTGDEVGDQFYHFLLGDSVPEDLSRLYSAFIVEFSSEDEFREHLNLIREGLVIYSALISAQEPNEQGIWRTDLKVVLDTELLLTMGGFNGPVYQQFFDDFYSLVKEVNNANASRGKKARISLHYLEEGKNQIEGIFARAEATVGGRDAISAHSTTAHRTIINGCSTPSDVLEKKARFYRRLEIEGIREIESSRVYERIPFNVEDSSLLKALSSDAARVGSGYSQDEIAARLEQFTIINHLRGGVSSSQFEMSNAILLTGDRLTRFLGNDPRVKFNIKDSPFAIDIDYITNRLWFNLNKGFRDKTSLPMSFDMVTRAQSVLGAQLRVAVNARYSKYKGLYDSGRIDRDEALIIFSEIRAKEIDPRTITEASLQDVLEFISDEHLDEKVVQVKQLETIAQNVPTLEYRLKSQQFENFLLMHRNFKSLLRVIAGILFFFIYSSPIYIGIFIFLLVRALQSEIDSRLAVVATFISFLIPLFPLWAKRHQIRSAISRGICRRYRSYLLAKLGRRRLQLKL
ncbi:MAG: hypothetical protein IPL32_13230 [Chloracidobacterium sp.]|nr:hypothetical protein [Chloracidobacterium sp.]